MEGKIFIILITSNSTWHKVGNQAKHFLNE